MSEFSPLSPIYLCAINRVSGVDHLSLPCCSSNPTSGDVFIGLDGFVGKSVSLRLFDQMGKQLWVLEMPQSQDEMIQLRLGEMGIASGIYTVVLQTADRTIAKRLIFADKN